MKKILISICIMLSAVSSVGGQEFVTTYFLDNNLYSYRINPAIPSEKNFVGLVTGNINLSIGTNLGINSLLYPDGKGGLVTGLHGSVSASEFLGNLSDVSGIDQSFSWNILAVGFWTKNAFHNIEVNLRQDAFAGLPKDLFEMFKCGSRTSPYDIGDISLSAKSFAEVAYGYSRKIGETLSIGGRVKFLVGLVNANVGFEKGNLTLDGNSVSYDLDARLRMSSSFLELGRQADKPGLYDLSDISFNSGNITPGGFGGAVDLGVTYKPLKNLTISYSIVDLGGISWDYNILGKSSGSDRFTGEIVQTDGELKGELENFTDKLETLADFESVGGGESSFDMLSCTMHLGARYYMPFYENLSAGLLATYRISKLNPYVGVRFGGTVTPLKWLSLTGNYGFNTYCNSFGAAMSVNMLGVNLVLGYEGYSGETAKVKVSESAGSFAVPVGSMRNTLKLGLNVTFGQRHTDALR